MIKYNQLFQQNYNYSKNKKLMKYLMNQLVIKILKKNKLYKMKMQNKQKKNNKKLNMFLQIQLKSKQRRDLSLHGHYR